MNYAKRRARARAVAAAQDIAVLVVTNPANVTYLTGFTGSNGTVILTTATNTAAVLLTDRRYDGRTPVDDDLQVVFDTVAKHVRGMCGTIGLEADHLSWAHATRLIAELQRDETVLLPTTGIVETLREVKDADEIKHLATACAITTAALQHVLEHTPLVGATEQVIAEQISATMRRLGADGDAFAPIVAAGVNGAIPHHSPTERAVKVGELVTIDCGARVNGYHADCTRTIAVGRTPGDELATIYQVVRDAQQAATAALQSGVTCDMVDAAARDVIADAGYGDYFVHGTGHGVGLEIHETPLIGPQTTATIAKSVTCTSEPGIYLPGVGGVRIEDTVVVAGSGPPQILTASTRDLVIV